MSDALGRGFDWIFAEIERKLIEKTYVRNMFLQDLGVRDGVGGHWSIDWSQEDFQMIRIAPDLIGDTEVFRTAKRGII